ncbi:hypothetical protein Plhal703r1_c48g0151401 [Plasmopara halstedii]
MFCNTRLCPYNSVQLFGPALRYYEILRTGSWEEGEGVTGIESKFVYPTIRRMCVYLAPRWRRRLSRLLLSIMLMLMIADGRTLRGLKTGSDLESDDNQKVGVVATDTHQSTSVVAWNPRRGTKQSDEKSVSFDNLMNTNMMPCPKNHSGMVMISTSKLTPTQIGDSNYKVIASRTQTDDHDKHGLLGSKISNEQLSNNKPGHTKRLHEEMPASFVPMTPSPTNTPTATFLDQKLPQSFHAVPESSLSSDFSELEDERESISHSDTTKSAEALDNHQKSSSFTSETRSLEQSIVELIVIIIGTIAGLLAFASRQILKEMGDDDDASFF